MKRQQQNIDVWIIFKCREILLEGKYHSSVTEVPQRVCGTSIYFEDIRAATTGPGASLAAQPIQDLSSQN